MKEILTYITSISLLFAALLPANAESILIDLSSASAVTNPAGDGKHWNVLGDHTGGKGSSDASVADLIDSTSASTGFGLTVDVTNILSNGTSGAGFGGDGINGPSAADPFDESAVITDGLFNNNANNGTAVFIFKGLTANAQYDFSAIGGRASNGVDGQIVVLDSNTPLGTADVTTQAAYTLPNNGSVLSFFAISNASGEIFFEFRRKHTNSTNGNATINALSITEPLGLIQSFSASETSVEAGAEVTLSWAASDFDTLVIQPGDVDAAALSTSGSGSTQVTVNDSTTYTLTASKNGSELSRALQIVIQADNDKNDNISDADEDQHDLDSNGFVYLAGDLQADGSILLTWPSQPGTSFEIHSSTDLSDWSTLVEANYPASDSGANTSYTIPAPAEPYVFYRIGLNQVSPPNPSQPK